MTSSIYQPAQRFKTYPDGAVANLIDPRTPDQAAAWLDIPEEIDRSADVVVAGGGISGIAAAIAAARRGCSVILIEPTHMLGGQATAAGVSAFDITYNYDHALNDHGIWSEVMERVIRIYDEELRRPVNVCHYLLRSIGPNVVVVERVFFEMLRDEGITVLRNTAFTGAYRSGPLVTGVQTTAGPVMGKIVIDATETGEIMALAGVPHRVANGRSNGLTYQPSNAYKGRIQDITYTATIRRYDEGLPEALKITEAPQGYEGWLNVFRTFYPPEGVENPQKKGRFGPNGFAGYRAAVDLSISNMQIGTQWDDVTRTNLNYYNDLPVYGSYLTDPEAKLKFEAEGILKTIGIIYYLQNELGLPWSVVTDEGFNDGPQAHHNPYVPEVYAEIEKHMPLIPYIRESRRLIGEVALTGKMMFRRGMHTEAPWRSDSIAVGTYHPDLHGGRRPIDFEEYLGESIADKPVRETFGPYPIPMGTLIPEWVDGFLAAEKNISTSRLASGATRVHPTVSAVGEAAGAIAAICVKYGVQPRQVPVAAVQLTLAEGGVLLTPLFVDGVEKGSPEFVKATLAIARKRVPMPIARPRAEEPRIEADLTEAVAAGEHSIGYLEPWRIEVRTPAMA